MCYHMFVWRYGHKTTSKIIIDMTKNGTIRLPEISLWTTKLNPKLGFEIDEFDPKHNRETQYQ